MFERVNDISESLLSGSGGGEELDTGPFADLLIEGERPKHVLAGDQIEHVSEGRTTTLEPDGDHDVFLVVTDKRVLVVLGDQPDVVEIEFDHASVSKSALKDGFLNSKLVVGHADESIHFSPTDGAVETVAEYVDEVTDAYRSVETAIKTAEGMLDSIESQVRTDGTGEELWLRLKSQLSEARHYATEGEDIPTEKILDRITEAAAEFDRRYVAVWLERGEADIEDAKAALTADDHDVFCECYTRAARAARVLEDVIDDVEDAPEDADERIETLSERVEGLDETYVSETLETVESARAASETETTATKSLTAFRRLFAAREAGWDRTDGIAEIGIDSELKPIAEMGVEAFEDHADRLEEAGEEIENDDAEQAREHYERATERLQSAKGIADTQSAIEMDAVEERLASLEEKIDRTKWEWGGD